jgi:hypothetical protein
MRNLLPGSLRAIQLHPAPRWPIALRNTRPLHGVITTLLNGHHVDTHTPAFALVPWPHGENCCGWALQTLSPVELVSQHHVSIFSEPRILTLGPRVRLRMPALCTEGEHLLCLDTVTPISVRTGQADGSSVYRTAPAEISIVSALRNSRWIAAATGIDLHRGESAPLSVAIVGGETHVERVPVGQTRPKTWTGGVVIGWAGRVILRCDARTRWLLEIAERVGLGGRVSLGFGRFRLRDLATCR